MALLDLLSMEPWAAEKKNCVAVSPAPVRVPSQRLLAPSVASVTSVAKSFAERVKAHTVKYIRPS